MNLHRWIALKGFFGGSASGGGGGDTEEKSTIDAIIDRSITEIESDAEVVGPYAFANCSKLVSARFPNAVRIESNAIQCSKLTSLFIPKVKYIASYAISSCSELNTIDLPSVESLASSALSNNKKLSALILRNTNKMATLSRSSALSGTPIESGTGYIYVPRVFLNADDATSDYRQATNWSVYASQFRALEDYTVDGTTTGELDPNKI